MLRSFESLFKVKCKGSSGNGKDLANNVHTFTNLKEKSFTSTICSDFAGVQSSNLTRKGIDNGDIMLTAVSSMDWA